MSQLIDLQVLARYLDRVATAEDQVAVDAWLRGDAARRTLLTELEAAWRVDAARLGGTPDANAVWMRLARQLELSGASAGAAPSAPRILRLMPADAPRSRAVGAAKWAAVLVGCTVGGLITRQVLHSRASAVANSTRPFREYVTPRGQRASFRLADGSEIMLNGESRLRVPLAFGLHGGARVVELAGQGNFMVVHDEKHPFIVRTAHGTTRDVGTRFDIRAYPDDSTERIVVTEGQVAVRATITTIGHEVSLRAGQVVTLTAGGAVVLQPHVSIDQEVAWTRGQLVLRDVTVADAVQQLERWYGLDISVSDSTLLSRRVSGTYADEPISDVLTVLTATVGARYEWRGRAVVLSPADPKR